MPFRSSGQRGGSVLNVILVLVGLLVLAAFTVPYFFTYYMMRQLTEGKPGMAMQPVPLPESPVLDATPTLVSAGGFEIAVPWGKLDRNYDSDFSRSYYFSNRWLWIQKEIPFLEAFSGPGGTQPTQRDALKQAYGIEVPAEPYEATKLFLERDAKPPRILSGYRKMVAEMMLVTAKSSLIPDPTNAIYSFELPHARGFQINKPEGSVEIRLLLFFHKGKPLSLGIHRAPDDPPFTQAEINFIVRNVRVEEEKPAVPQPPAKTASRPQKKAA